MGGEFFLSPSILTVVEIPLDNGLYTLVGVQSSGVPWDTRLSFVSHEWPHLYYILFLVQSNCKVSHNTIQTVEPSKAVGN